MPRVIRQWADQHDLATVWAISLRVRSRRLPVAPPAGLAVGQTRDTRIAPLAAGMRYSLRDVSVAADTLALMHGDQPVAADGRPRCDWGAWGDPLYLAYHDEEWGVPSRDQRHVFELLILEGAQAGLSWSTILRKREGYRAAFAGFDPRVVAGFDDADVARLMSDPGIVRNRAKIDAAIGNARATINLPPEDGGLVEFVWRVVGDRPIQNRWTSVGTIPAETAVSQEMSRDLKARGFRFVGPTICYAFMQSVGLVNDHTVSCFRHAEVAALG